MLTYYNFQMEDLNRFDTTFLVINSFGHLFLHRNL